MNDQPLTTISERVRRIAHGTLANAVGQALNMGGQLAFVPILLSYWGNQQYGEWLALSAAASYLTTLDMGMQTYVVNRLNQAYALGKMDEYTSILHTGFLVNTVVPALAFLLAIPLIFATHVEQVLHLKVTAPSEATWVAVLLSFQVVFSITSGLLGGIYRATNEYARGQMISNARLFANFAFSLAVVMAGGGLRAVATVQVVIGLALAVVIYWDISHRRPEISIGFSKADWRLALTFLAPSSLFFGIQIVAALNVQGSSLMVNQMFGAAALVVFASLRTVSNLIRQAASTIQQAVWPEFTTLDARPQGDTLRNLHLVTAKLVMLVVVCGSAFVAVVGERLIAFWTRGRVQYDHALMAALLVYACVQSHAFVSSVLLSACNRQKVVLNCSAAGTLGGFALGYALSGPMGIAGFVLGLAIGDAVFSGLYLPYVACRMINESVRRFLREVTLRSAILFIVIYGAMEFLYPWLQHTRNDVQLFAFAALAITTLGAAAAYAVTLDSHERGQVRTTISSLLTR